MNRQFAFVAAAVFTLAGVVQAQQALPAPRLDSVFPFSGQVGTSVEVTVSGDAIEGAQQLLFSNPEIKAEPIVLPADAYYPSPRAADNRLKVTIPASVAPGAYEVRLMNRMGLTNARRFIVGAEVETLEKEPNNDIANASPVAIGSAVNGVCDGQTRDFFRFTAKKGQRLIIHCMARRADSAADVVLSLLGADGTLIKRAHDSVRLDPTIDFTPPSDGDFLLCVNDFIYEGGPRYPYRLSITTGPWIDFIDPPFTIAGASNRHVLFGRNLPGGVPAEGVTVGGQPLEKLEVTITPPGNVESIAPALDTLMRPRDGAMTSMSYKLGGPAGTFSNPVRLAVVSGSITPEHEPNDTPATAQLLTMPAQILMRSNPRGDRDWFGFEARKGEKYWIEVMSHRLDQPTDPILFLQRIKRDEKGVESLVDVQQIDDSPRLSKDGQERRYDFTVDDPSVLFEIPEDGSYRLLVRDLYSAAQGGPQFFQLLSIRRAGDGDFMLRAHVGRPNPQEGNQLPGSFVLRPGGSTTVDVLAFRTGGCTGPITVMAEGLPAGVTAPPVVMASWADLTTLVLQAAPNAANWAGTIRIVGRATLGGADITRQAISAEVTSPRPEGADANVMPERLVQDIALAIRDDIVSPASAIAGQGQALRTARGGKLEVPVSLTRNGSFAGEVKFDSLIPNTRVRETSPLNFAGGETSKNLVLDVNPDSPLGSFSMLVRGNIPVKYSRSPEVVATADADKKRIEQVLANQRQATQKSRQETEKAEAAQQQARNKAAEAEQQRQSTAQQKAQADEAQRQAAAEAKTAQAAVDAAAEAQKAADAAVSAAQPPALEAAKQAASEAAARLNESMTAAKQKMQQFDAANAAMATAADKLAKAEEAKTKADLAIKMADEAKNAAQAALQQAQADEQAGEQARRVAEERFNETRQFAEVKDLRVYVYSSPATIEIVDTPFTLTLSSTTVNIKAGAMPADVTATLSREFGFADEVRFELIPPQGVGGLSLVDKANVVAAGQPTGVISISANAGTPPGVHECRLRTRYKFNGRDLSSEHPCQITVMPPDEKK